MNTMLPSAFTNAPITLSNPVKIADSLQGSIWRASRTDNTSVILKLTDRDQHMNSTAIINGNQYQNIQEDILLEQSILKHITESHDCPQSIAKFITFFETDDHLVLTQEDGGSALMNFIKQAHQLIQASMLDIDHWKAVVKVIFSQMIECIAFIHSKCVCHNDISIENFVINDVECHVEGKIKFVLDDIRIKLCDFGLAELHANAKCLSSKHCGKRGYKSPEVIALKENFSGPKNDLWASGVCLFMLSFGCAPCNTADVSDETFNCIMNGRMSGMLRSWHLSAYVDTYLVELLESIFKVEEDRISVDQVYNHIYFRR